MSAVTHPVRLLLAVLAVALAATAAVTPAAPAHAQSGVTIARVGTMTAEDPVGAAIAWSQATYQTASTAVIATAGGGADALASGALTGGRTRHQGLSPQIAMTATHRATNGAPLLLVTDVTDVNPGGRVAEELDRLETDIVYVIGGTAAVSQDVRDALTARGLEVIGDAGASRLETAARLPGAAGHAVIARAYGTADNPDTAFADSVGAASLAAAVGYRTLLADDAMLDADGTLASPWDYTFSRLTTATIVGGTAAVSAAFEQALRTANPDVEIIRLGGADRNATAALVADRTSQVRGHTINGITHPTPMGRYVLVDSSTPGYWVDAFAATGWANANDAAVVHVSPTTLQALTDQPPTAEDGIALMCGVSVDPATCATYADAAGGDILDGPPAPVRDDAVQVFASASILASPDWDEELPKSTTAALGDFDQSGVRQEVAIHDLSAVELTVNGGTVTDLRGLLNVMNELSMAPVAVRFADDGSVDAIDWHAHRMLIGRVVDIDFSQSRYTLDPVVGDADPVVVEQVEFTDDQLERLLSHSPAVLRSNSDTEQSYRLTISSRGLVNGVLEVLDYVPAANGEDIAEITYRIDGYGDDEQTGNDTTFVDPDLLHATDYAGSMTEVELVEDIMSGREVVAAHRDVIFDRTVIVHEFLSPKQ